MKKSTHFSIPGIVLFSLIFFAIVQCTNETKYSESVEQNIKKVETSLTGWYQTQDKETWSLADRMKLFRVNGLCIAVIHNYKMEWVKGYGLADTSEKRPVTDKTLFQAASVSKSFNAIAMLKLVQDKKLDLNRDINDYLKTWKFPYDSVSHKKLITTAALLSHTAGLTIHGFPGYAVGDSLPALQQVLDGKRPANTEAVRSMEEPGTKVSYSGGGITISQLILKDITGEPYEAYLQKNILDPLGMKSSSFTQPPDKSKAGLLATGYKGDGKEVKGKYHIYPEQAAAGLWTNPADLCKYIIETQLSYKGESSKVLTPEMTKLRLTPVLGESALGVFISKKGDIKYFSHNGGNEGFTCVYIGSLEGGDGVVIMTNSDNGSILEEIVNTVATVYGWKDYYKPVIKNVIEVKESVLEKYTGKYEVQDLKIVIKKEGKDLMMKAFGDQFWKLCFTSDSDFFIKEYRADFRFKFGPHGKVTGFISNGMPVKKVE